MKENSGNIDMYLANYHIFNLNPFLKENFITNLSTYN